MVSYVINPTEIKFIYEHFCQTDTLWKFQAVESIHTCPTLIRIFLNFCVKFLMFEVMFKPSESEREWEKQFRFEKWGSYLFPNEIRFCLVSAVSGIVFISF